MLKLTLLRLVVTDRVPATRNRIFGYTESAIKVAFQKVVYSKNSSKNEEKVKLLDGKKLHDIMT